ncbi:hypothetical protein TNCV_1037681 [Trichonephila clavipes]|nr:hypothetical protein TNCV_1037681 [Trichonephila clavipes]
MFTVQIALVAIFTVLTVHIAFVEILTVLTVHIAFVAILTVLTVHIAFVAILKVNTVHIAAVPPYFVGLCPSGSNDSSGIVNHNLQDSAESDLRVSPVDNGLVGPYSATVLVTLSSAPDHRPPLLASAR